MPSGQAPAGTDRCPRCDAAFGCGVATGSCWCAEAKLGPERLAELAVAYDGCLCPRCVRELESDGRGDPRRPLASNDGDHD